MKVTLRKANTLQLSINEQIKSLNFETMVHLNQYEDVSEQIENMRSAFDTNYAVRSKLVSALYEIRKAVARENARAGINDMLAEVAQLEKDIQFYSSLASNSARLSDAVIEGKMEKLRNSKEEGLIYGRTDSVDTGIFSKAELDSFKRMASDFRRQKQKLQDTLLEANVRAEIDLEDETVRFLESVDVL